MFFLLVLSAGCVSLSLSDEWKEQRRNMIDRQMAESSRPVIFNSFAFLKENNPSLEEDIVCSNLSTLTIPFVLKSQVDMPCMLVPTFSLEYGKLFYNGEELVSGVSEIYCSFNQDALIRIEGSAGKNEYHFLSFVPFSSLPVVEIITDGQVEVNSLNDWIDGLMVTHGMGSYPDSYDSVRVRNLSLSKTSPKLSFKVEMQNAASVLGMKSNRNWCFLANFEDRTQLRNSVAFEIGRLAGGLEWTPSSQFASVTVNGKYQGLYQIAEQICIDENRVNIDRIVESSSNITGGYLLEVDNEYDELWRFHPKNSRWNVNVVSPTDDDCSYEKLVYIKSFWNDMESQLDTAGYKTLCDNYMDIGSFIDYGLVQSLTSNNGLSEQKSVFCYKKKDGKLFAGPVWNFEYYSFNNDSLPLFSEFLWYRCLKDDIGFHEQIKEHWNELKPAVESRIYNYIDSLADVIATGVRNGEKVYPYSVYHPVFPNDDDNMDFEAAAGHLKSFLNSRISWMNEEINALK